jgi:hypothetical protein
VDRPEILRVIDFGLAVPIGVPLRGFSPDFAPPEAAPGAVARIGGDLYSFGATLRACGVPLRGALGDVVDACLAASPAARPATADTLLGMLGQPVQPIDRGGEPPRVGATELVTAVEEALLARSGAVIVVEGPAGSGRTRLVGDGCRRALEAGRGIGAVSLAAGHDPFSTLAGLVLPYQPEPGREASLALATAAR